jgi:pimeloyl-ACP methyl ester carboxylesterase
MGSAEPHETRALTRYAFDELRGGVGGVHEIHRAIAGRAFSAVGPGALPARAIHDAITQGVYDGLRGATSLLARTADAGLRLRPVGNPRWLSTSPRGALLLGALNGLIGDALERERSDLEQTMAVRVGGRPVEAAPASLAAAFPRATPRIVIFLHGLMETELAWRLGAGPDGETYGARLARDLDRSPVDIRYNSGRHVSANGRSLADLLERLVAAWPVEVDQVALIGHSMGGLVARSACHYGAERGDRWVGLVRHVVSLGTPHLGAQLVQAVHWLSAGLGILPETRAFGAFLRRRSAGIRDLRQGSLVDDDWRDRDPEQLRAAACREVPLLEGATHCFVAATITRSTRHPLGRLMGDCLVLEPSASGRGRTRRIPFRTEHGMHLGGAHHLALLNHTLLYERLREWLSVAPPADGARSSR